MTMMKFGPRPLTILIGAQWRQNELNSVSSPKFPQILKDQRFILVT